MVKMLLRNIEPYDTWKKDFKALSFIHAKIFFKENLF